jgi:4'-phosphopantetheinyl transferase EntD
MRLAARLFDDVDAVRTAEMDPREAMDGLFPEEAIKVARAVEKRRREFVAGRACARRAMADLGLAPRAIPSGEDRAPIWPDDVIGTITHTDTWCAAAIARAGGGVRALGLDVEPDTPLNPALLKTIALPEERAEIEARPEALRGLLGKLLFSAKECAYKCQYPLTRTFFGFQGMRVHLDLEGGAFVAVFQREAGAFRPGDELRGRLLVDGGYVMTAMALCE